ncbi:furin-like protease 1, isoforms 1/1-X/2 isoform X2 [Belonocnema kinseyi]|uniref:furin-like protease 1, isoforms 1/1-X/2 isoform X2 n=1 Tax=Belonocnema kinseyi TaxID=2817044 RepID=UPI00143D9361|nr:furin-like protease 1, isoforms 1/1-X/2 isoform X2 [Belonocnema kinseyi]
MVVSISSLSRMIIDDWYHLEHRLVMKRSAVPHTGVHEQLSQDYRVHRAEQQRAKSRSKRDFIIKHGQFKTQIVLNDERWSLMWYLNRGSGLDMNVQGAWTEGITGHGVVVTILDDGLEKDHPDLKENYDPQASYDVNNHDEDPMPRYDLVDSNRHGTRCAGEVAATANNSICSVGVAFHAQVGGVRMLDGDVTDAVEARSLSLNPQHIDIYSASWGPDDDGKTVDGPGELATRAFIEGVTKGRDGKGSIFVWASGNGGRDHDNCNCDGYTNSIWTLSISSATENGLVPWYSEACSSTLATTYSSGSTGEKQVVTTDLHHYCTSSHTGTSASAPLAAGICALALEANKNLTWRDMQHIVVRTAKPANLKAPDWVTNGVGRNVSHSFGYGLMDATAMVLLARKWRTVPEQHNCEVSAPQVGRAIPAKSQLILELHVKECSGVNFLEHVQAKVSLSASRRGDLQIHLTSPQGTKSTLLAKRPHDVSKAGFHQWPFMSVHTWGERPHGIWKLEIHNEGRYLGRATLHEWALFFYGTSTIPDRKNHQLYNPTAENMPRRPFVKSRKNNYFKSQNSLAGRSKKGKQTPQHTLEKMQGLLNSHYAIVPGQVQRKSKTRGQHKSGKNFSRPTSRQASRPTIQTLRGLTVARGSKPGDVRLITSKPRGRSTSNPMKTNTNVVPTTKSWTYRSTLWSKSVDLVTESSMQQGIILMEPASKSATNKIPKVFQQYPKFQQLYPLYPLYTGAHGLVQHATGEKGLDLLQDGQFDSRNLQFDKDHLEEWKLVFYGTDTSLDIDNELGKDEPEVSGLPLLEVPDDTTTGARQNMVDMEGDPLIGSQQMDRVSHSEDLIQRPSNENQASGGCKISNGAHGCLVCKPNWYLNELHCVFHCPAGTYAASDESHSVCVSCHYSCATCSGPTGNECTSCHQDSVRIESNCVLTSIAWKMQATSWFYRMTIFFVINLSVITAAAIYLCVSWFRRKLIFRTYDYGQVGYSSNVIAQCNADDSSSESE